ncbi:MAG: class I SAM-dependent DNA methyltransferase [Thermoanaerobaculia bacterium]
MTRDARDSYGDFAYAYDQALGQKFFSVVSKLLDDLLVRYPPTERTHLDLACGTGLAAAYFARKGFRSVGVDGSVPMLAIARTRARVVAGDLRELPVRGTFARITCLYDSLNHFLQKRDLVSAFEGAASLMDADSLFFFDMNHPQIYPKVWGLKEPFISHGTGHHLEIDTAFSSFTKRGVGRVSGWAIVDGKRVEIDETHRQRAYGENEIERALRDAGLATLDVFDFDPFDEAGRSGTVKLFFVARRV